MKPDLIAFCGSKFSGKSTSATIFKNFNESQVEELALASFLKLYCAEVFHVPLEYFLNPDLKEKELDTLVFLDHSNLVELVEKFGCSYDHEAHIRPHVGKVLTTPRALLQYIGTDVLHPIDRLVHVKNLIKQKDPRKTTVVTDLRFKHEFDFFKNYFKETFYPVFVDNRVAQSKAQSDGHKSETEVFEFKNQCRIIDNNSTLAELEGRIKELYNEVYTD